MPRHYSATFEIAERTRLSLRTVRRYTRRPKGGWLRLTSDDIDLVVAALEEGRLAISAQPRRHAIPFNQLTLNFD